MAKTVSEQQLNPDEGQEYLNILEPLLQAGDLNRTAECIKQFWCGGKLCAFLTHDEPEVRRAAAMGLTLVGNTRAIDPLVTALHDTDLRVSELAQDALWAIWFRAGNARACGHLKCGAHHLKHGNLDAAMEKFNLAIQVDPGFAEAYNQRAIAEYLAERYTDSMEDCRRTLAIIPRHFGAMAGMGHCHANLGNFPDARQCYCQALEINPLMDGIAAALEKIQALLEKPAA